MNKEQRIIYSGIECVYFKRYGDVYWVQPIFNQGNIGNGCGMGKTISEEEFKKLKPELLPNNKEHNNPDDLDGIFERGK